MEHSDDFYRHEARVSAAYLGLVCGSSVIFLLGVTFVLLREPRNALYRRFHKIQLVSALWMIFRATHNISFLFFLHQVHSFAKQHEDLIANQPGETLVFGRTVELYELTMLLAFLETLWAALAAVVFIQAVVRNTRDYCTHCLRMALFEALLVLASLLFDSSEANLRTVHVVLLLLTFWTTIVVVCNSLAWRVAVVEEVESGQLGP